MWIKLCGIRDVSTAQQIAALGPDAIGLNFHPPSPRCVAPDTARIIAAALPPSIAAVGVFVNHALDEIGHLIAHCRLTMLQLHGDEPPEFLAALQQQHPTLPLIRAWRMENDLDDLRRYLAECDALQIRLAGCLIDAKVAGSFGGTGHVPPWNVLRAEYDHHTWPPLILAGGLTPDNVAEGIRTVQPWGVDTASGIETSPGEKDLDRAAQFLAAARGD